MSPGSLPDVFLDTDVAFDIISKREPHFISSIRVLQLAAQNSIRLMISESSLANLIYLAYDIYKLRDATDRLTDFIAACEMAHATRDIAIAALTSDFKDKEDALQYFTAIHGKADYFITRNKKDYKRNDPMLPVYSPDEFIKSISS